MNSTNITAKIVGVLFLTAMAASLSGAGILETVLNIPDYFTKLSSNEKLLKTGVLLEFINGIAVTGIAILLFPVLKKHNEKMAVAYLSFRILETLVCIAAAILPLSVLAVSREIADISNLQLFSNLLLIIRADVANILIPLFFSLSALILYTFLYQTKLLPRFISVWGFIGVASIVTLNIINIETSVGMILALPIILNEIFMGIWLILKGFKQITISSFKSI